jgi:hypothetical protein
MGATQLTPRQIETLRHIHDFISKNGFSPSISELRNALGVASDQGVMEILHRLEDRGMIEKRTPGQARSLKLTAEAYLAIGVPSPQTAGRPGSVGLGNPFELNPQQQRIFKRLTDLDPKLARMYEGGLRVLADATNPERIALSAHSLRESTHHLSNMGKGLLTKEEANAATELKVSNARQLEKLFDPLGGARYFNQTLYDIWSREFHNFFVEVSHHRREVTLDEYRAKLAQFEEFLGRYVLPLQTEIYARLDEQLSRGPRGASVEDLKFLLSRNLESYRYFFRKADARWLGFLNRHSLIFPNWETTDYLARIASTASEDVMATLEGMKTLSGDWATRKGFIDAAIKMPPAIACRIIAKMEQEHWLAEHYVSWLTYPLNDLLGIFISSGRHEDALRLAALLLPGVDGPEPDLKSYHREQLLKRFSAVPESELIPYIKLLVQSLGTAISLERPEKQDDRSSMWRPAIEDHEQNWEHGEKKDHMVTALRDALGRYTEHLRAVGEQNISRILDDLLKWNPSCSIFMRLKLHCYRKNADLFGPEIESAISEQFEQPSAWHEYFLLLKEQFSNLSKKIRTGYLEMVKRGPQGERDETYIRHWKAHRLAPIIEDLSASESKRFSELLPEARKLRHPDFLTYHGGIWVGPTSPAAESDLAAMSIGDAIECLATWNPPKDQWFSSSREGLARSLSAVVGQNAEAFSKEALRFSDPRIRPVYVYHLFLGLQQGLKSRMKLDWSKIVMLAATIVERAESGTLPIFEADKNDDEVEWVSVLQEIGTVLEDGLGKSDASPDFGLREDLWKVIEFLCEHPNPSAEYEKQYGSSNMDPVTLSINTVRGRAFHALFAYIFWCDRHLGGKAGNKSRIPQEAKNILELHLDPARDQSLAVRSVYGLFFPWLFVYDPVWANTLVERIFPADDAERRYAAWETYLSNVVFLQVYAALKPQYELAISEARKFKPTRRYWSDPIERLADHMMIAYIQRAEDEKGAAWSKFFHKATAKQRGRAVNFAGRAYVFGDPSRLGGMIPAKNRLQEFWEWRLRVTKDAEELQEFGWWVKDGYFDDKWMLERLIETLTKTEGALAADFYALEALAKLAPIYPELCARALSLIVKSRSTDRWTMADRKEISSILTTVHTNADPDINELAANIIDHLTKLGFESYRAILENPAHAVVPELAHIVRG